MDRAAAPAVTRASRREDEPELQGERGTGGALAARMQSARGWRAAQMGFVLAYVAAIAVVLHWEHGRRAFWTCALASLPLLWVAFGFHAWRRVCPLAFFAGSARRDRREESAPRPPRWLVKAAPLVQLGLMVAALAARHAWLNGDRVALAAFLVALAGAAFVVGRRWSGRAWCHTVCPVGLVERIYTEADPAPVQATSGCAPCTGCVSRCPDLDPRRSHRAGLFDGARLVAWTAWPGVVLAFYLAFFLEEGRWGRYFSGAWAYDEAPPTTWRLVAPALLLLAGGALSSLLLLGLERAARALGADPARTRHRTLVGAGALAFCAFYAFAGQPTLLAGPPAVWLAAAAAVGVAAARMLARRWTPARAASPARRGTLLPLAA